jgi:mono/diheme cytochrome c family protein
MRSWKLFLLISGAMLVALGFYGMRLVWSGFSTADQPSFLETVVARTARNLSIPRKARLEKNPWTGTADVLKEARESFVDRCAVCHGPDGSGETQVGSNLYPKVPDLRTPRTQKLTDGEIRYIIRNGVRLTGMPGWAKPHDEQGDDSWKLVIFIRSLGLLSKEEHAQQVSTANSARYVGSLSCEKCHAQIYEHWRKTPMANVVRDPREHSDAIIPDLSTNTIAKFTKDDVALVYGSGDISRKEATIIFRSRRSGTLLDTFGGSISWLRERIGGSRFIRRTICSGPRVRPVTVAIL